MSESMSELFAHSRWLWIDSDPDESNTWAWFRRRFEPAEPHGSWLNISADLRYVAWINGRMIGFGPPKYHITTPTYDRYALDGFLSNGGNVLCVLVYSMGNAADISSCMPRRGAMLAAIEAGGTVIPSDHQWRAKREMAYLKTALRRSEVQPHNEVFDARLSLGEPWRFDYDDSDWPSAIEISQSPRMEPWERLEQRDIPLIPWHSRTPDRIIETGIVRFTNVPADPANVDNVAEQIALASRSVDTDGHVTVHAISGSVELNARGLPSDAGCYVRWDFGRLWTGYPVIEIAGVPGTVVDLSYGEYLSEGRIDPRKHGLHYFDRLILNDQPLRHRILWPKCLRYLQVDVRGAGSVEIRSLQLEISTYPVQWRGNFHSSDPTLDQAWSIAAHTLQLCMEDNYMDTPWRERGSWLGDIVPQAHGNYYAFGDAALHRRFLIHHARGQMPDGRMHGKYPGGGEHHIPTWSLTFPITLADYIRHTGDVDLAHRLWPTCWRIGQWLETFRTAEGLYGDFPIEVTESINHYVFIDWAPVNTSGANSALNAFAFAFYTACEHIAGLAGDTQRQLSCRERRERLQNAYRTLLWDAERGIFVNGRDKGRRHRRWGVQENYLAVLFGLADDRQRLSIIQRLKKEDLLSYFMPDDHAHDLSSAWWAIAVNRYRWDEEKMVPLGTPYFAYWATQALCEMGLLREALDLIRRHWGTFSRDGGTTAWEQWTSQGSLSHGWGTAPLVVAGKYILGVSPSAADPNHLEIFPQRADLAFASGRIGFPPGIVEIRWTWHQHWTMTLNLPAPFRATVGLPSDEAPTLFVNGELASTTSVRRNMTQFNTLYLPPGHFSLTSSPNAATT